MDDRWRRVGAWHKRPVWDEYLRALAANVFEPVRLEPERLPQRSGDKQPARRLRWPSR